VLARPPPAGAAGQEWQDLDRPLSKEPLVDGHGEVEYIHKPHFYSVSLGLASPAALVYWTIVAGLLAHGAMRARLGWRRLAVAVPATFAVGAAIAVVLTVMPGQARSADSVVPELLPKVPADPELPDTQVVTPTVLSDQQYDPGCITHEDGTTVYHCDRAHEIAAAPSRERLLAFWTSQPRPRSTVELRVRDVSLSGEPLGASKPLIAAWPRTHPDQPDYANCEEPVSLQAAPLDGGDVLVAWSNSCLIYSRHEPAEVTGLVVSSGGEVVKGPFVLARFSLPPAASNASNPPFWLRSTSAGQPLLVWRAKSPTADHSQMTYAAFLTPSLQVDDSAPIAGSQEAGTARIGSVGVACGETCLIAHSLDGAVELTFLAGDGRNTEQRIERNPAVLNSELAVAAHGELFFVGWLESEVGVTVTAHIATVQAGHAASETAVAENTPTGEDAPTIPKPVGILLERGLPSLTWLTKSGVDRHESMLLHVAGPKGMIVRRLDAWLLDAMMPLASAPTIIGVGWIEGLSADPLSARFA
jgi:hypothetical protein